MTAGYKYKNHIVIETFSNSYGVSLGRKLFSVPKEGLLIEVGGNGATRIIEPIDYKTKIGEPIQTQVCITCKGKKIVQYWYARDESVSAKCPTCSGGNQEEWDKKKQDWAKFCE